MLFSQSILREKGQWSKFIATLLLVAIGAVVLVLGISKLSSDNSSFGFALILMGASTGLLSFVFACYSIRCNECDRKLFWHAVSRKGSESWLMWLLDASKCPGCTIESR